MYAHTQLRHGFPQLTGVIVMKFLHRVCVFFVIVSFKMWKNYSKDGEKNLVRTISSVMQSLLFDFCSHQILDVGAPARTPPSLPALLRQVSNFKCVIPFLWCAYAHIRITICDPMFFPSLLFNISIGRHSVWSANNSQTSKYNRFLMLLLLLLLHKFIVQMNCRNMCNANAHILKFHHIYSRYVSPNYRLLLDFTSLQLRPICVSLVSAHMDCVAIIKSTPYETYSAHHHFAICLNWKMGNYP